MGVTTYTLTIVSVSMRKSTCHVDNLFRKPGIFRNIFGTMYFLIKFCDIIETISLPRGYLIRDNYAAYGFVERPSMSNCSLMRAFRFILFTVGWPVPAIAILCGQSTSTVYKDKDHVSYQFMEHIAPKVINYFIPYTREYYEHLGQGVFGLFPRVLYAIDVVKVYLYNDDSDDKIYILIIQHKYTHLYIGFDESTKRGSRIIL